MEDANKKCGNIRRDSYSTESAWIFFLTSWIVTDVTSFVVHYDTLHKMKDWILHPDAHCRLRIPMTPYVMQIVPKLG